MEEAKQTKQQKIVAAEGEAERLTGIFFGKKLYMEGDLRTAKFGNFEKIVLKLFRKGG